MNCSTNKYTSFCNDRWNFSVGSSHSEQLRTRTIEDSLKDLEFFVSTTCSKPQELKRVYEGDDAGEYGHEQTFCYYKESPERNERQFVGASEMPLKQKISSAIVPTFIDVPEESRFFVIKSFSLEHVKKSYLHGIWSSTYFGNKRLSEAYKKKNQKAKIYLLFSVNGSGKFCGVAEMRSDLQDNLDTSIWTDQNSKYGKAFKVSWIIVRDVHNRLLRQHLIPSNDMKPVTHSRDTQEIPIVMSVSILRTFMYHKNNVESFMNEE